MPFGWSCPASGAPMFPDCIALVAHGGAAPSAEALAFYEFATNAETSLALAEEHRRFLVRTDLPRPSWAARIEVRAMDVDWTAVGEGVDRWQRVWEDALADR